MAADLGDGEGDKNGDSPLSETTDQGVVVSTAEKPPLPGSGSPWQKTPVGEPLPPSEAVDDVVSIQIPDEILVEPNPLWRCYVVGYFIGDTPHVGSIHTTVNRIWSSPKMGSKIDVQFLDKTTVLFRIENPQMRARVTQRRYWHIADIPLVVNEWSPETALDPPDLSAMPIWIDLKGVPSLLFSHKALKCLSRAAGNFVKLHPHTKKCTRLDAARVLVEVDLNKPLVEKISCLDRDGRTVMIEVLYPWLPPKCNICNGWGHLVSNCQSKKISVMQKGKEVAVDKGDSDVVINGDGSEAFEVGDASTSVSSEQRKEEWALVGRSDIVEKRSSVGEDQESDVVVSPSKFSVLALERQEEENNDEMEEDVSAEKGEDENVGLDIEEGELVAKYVALKAKDSTKTARFRTGTSFKLSKQIPARAKDLKGKNQTNTRKTCSSSGICGGSTRRANTESFVDRVQQGNCADSLEAALLGWTAMSNYEFNPLGRVWFCWSDKVVVTKLHSSAQGMLNKFKQIGMTQFQEAVGDCILTDLTHSGVIFTLWNNQEAGPIGKKLD
ncbi:PREDICTED: uncharacterized protein LOC106344602 [Brassica oleracea var. oleracea]|uniref:uncharacterized protein LOC106344602 n=1 Tax=Brassica oleracea var. oleracea TaxID=109376 RepID=UPI0006A6D551|nr:PREDICTED: uncharacterized protein LOC106344602 [Brassica oleracea var. oleracea]